MKPALVWPKNFRGFILVSDIKESDSFFGTSLLLANIGTNSPMTPKIVNGSYAALFDNKEVTKDFSKRLQDIKSDKGIRITRKEFSEMWVIWA